MLSVFRVLERGKFLFVCLVYIMFLGEDGVDFGGLRREFFCFFMMLFKNFGIFYGIWFFYDLELFYGNKYKLVGKLVVWSVF